MPTIYAKANDRQDGESLIFLLTNVKKEDKARMTSFSVPEYTEPAAAAVKCCVKVRERMRRGRLIVSNWSCGAVKIGETNYYHPC